MKRLITLGSAALAALLFLAACGTSTPKDTEARNVQVSGQVLAPDGESPLADATVFVSGSASASAAGLTPLADEEECEAPAADEAAAAWTCTDADGHFSFTAELTGSSATLVVVKGSWRLEKTINVGTTEALVGTVEMDEADIPAMAVVTGDYDDMAGVLNRMGLEDSYDLYRGDSGYELEDYSKLFADDPVTGEPAIFGYDIVFFNCGGYAMDAIVADYGDIVEEFVNAGGSLYATDWGYKFITAAFPDYLEFRVAGGSGLPGLDATVVDATLAGWLENRTCINGDCLTEDGPLEIGAFLTNWAILEGPQDTPEGNTVKIWVEGDIGTATNPDVVPLTATFRHGAGRVLFTSYHSSPSAPTSGFLPQERVLEYLVFEL